MSLKHTTNNKTSPQSSKSKKVQRKGAPPPPIASLVLQAQQDPTSLATQDILQLQRTIGNRAVRRLLQTPQVTVQRYTQSRQSGQDGYFIPKMTAAIHCHIGGRMRNPHLKIKGKSYNFGNPHKLSRMQSAYDILVGDEDHKNLEGYDDCVEYLEEEGCVANGNTGLGNIFTIPQGPVSAYDDPNTSQFSRALIEEGLRTGSYPPRRDGRK